MKHARKRSTARRCVLPVLLAATCAVGFGGLTALPTPTQAQPAALAFTAPPAAPLLDAFQLEREQAAARASRSRRIAEARAAEAAAQAAAQAAAEAEAAARAKAEAEAAAAAKAAAEAQAQRAAAARGACPVPNARFTDTWGAARSGGRAHKGTDLLAPYGSPVYAVVAGRVRTASSSRGGISLYLDGVNGETYFYAHNAANVASNGERVEAGELIAKVGSTGNAGGTNHVHFEREVGGRSVNPYDFVRRLC